MQLTVTGNSAACSPAGPHCCCYPEGGSDCGGRDADAAVGDSASRCPIPLPPPPPPPPSVFCGMTSRRKS